MEMSSSLLLETQCQVVQEARLSMAPTAALIECFDKVGWSRRVFPGYFSYAFWTASIAEQKASEAICSVESKTNKMSVHLIFRRSRRKAVAPRKYHPDEVNGAIFRMSELVSHAGNSIQFQSANFSSVRSRMESKQVKTEKGDALYFQQFARHRTMSSCQVRPASVFECFKTSGTGAD